MIDLLFDGLITLYGIAEMYRKEGFLPDLVEAFLPDLVEAFFGLRAMGAH